MNKTKIKRLFFDIETSPNVGFFWKPGYQISIPYENIINERKVICICWKWEGDRKINSLTWDHKQCDKKMLVEFIKEINRADEIIAHNGDKFDLPWIRTRCLYHNIPMFPNYTTLDTLKKSRSIFNFNSNKLDYIAQFLGIGNKINTSFSLWKDLILHKDKKALEEMVEYCKKDVLLLEKIYNKLSSYIPSVTHHGVLNGYNKLSCPHCASSTLNVKGYKSTVGGTLKIRLICKNCNKTHSMVKSVYEKLKNEK